MFYGTLRLIHASKPNYWVSELANSTNLNSLFLLCITLLLSWMLLCITQGFLDTVRYRTVSKSLLEKVNTQKKYVHLYVYTVHLQNISLRINSSVLISKPCHSHLYSIIYLFWIFERILKSNVILLCIADDSHAVTGLLISVNHSEAKIQQCHK